jgi:hypothetical protein
MPSLTQLPPELKRIHDVYTTPKPAPHTKPRKALGFAAIIDRLTLVGQVMSKVEFANALLLGVVELLYDVDLDGEFANFDIDGRVIRPLPWGSAGCYEWHVRTSEAKCLRYIMRQRAERNNAWIVYRPESKGWYVTQRSSRHAYAMLRSEPITNEEWRHGWAVTKTAWARKNIAAG